LVRVVGAAAGVQQRGAARVVVECHTVLAPGGVPARPVAVPCIDELDVAGVEDEALLERADRDAAGIASVEEADVLLDAGTGRGPVGVRPGRQGLSGVVGAPEIGRASW